MRRRVSTFDNWDADLEDDEDDPSLLKSSTSFYSYILLTIVISFMTLVMVMHRASRPRELDSLFQTLDMKLEVPQKWLEK